MPQLMRKVVLAQSWQRTSASWTMHPYCAAIPPYKDASILHLAAILPYCNTYQYIPILCNVKLDYASILRCTSILLCNVALCCNTPVQWIYFALIFCWTLHLYFSAPQYYYKMQQQNFSNFHFSFFAVAVFTLYKRPKFKCNTEGQF